MVNNNLLDDMFEYREYDLDEFTKLVSGNFPVFGYLEVYLKEEEGGYKLEYTDRDISKIVVPNSDGEETEEREIDMSTRVLTLNLNENGVIKTIDHSYHLFTPANKREVVFCMYLINKKIIL